MRATSPAVAPLALGRERLQAGRARLLERLAGDVEAEEHARRALLDHGDRAGVRRHDGLGGQVALADVLGERGRDQLVHAGAAARSMPAAR